MSLTLPTTLNHKRRTPKETAGMETRVINRLPWASLPGRSLDTLVEREWILTNALGGYAAGTVAGVCTRRYHGLLIAALPAPLGRVMMFNQLAEELRLPNGKLILL